MSETNRAGATTNRVAQAWQDGARTIVGGYSEQLRRMAEMSNALWQPRWLDREQVREAVEAISRGTREVANAQVAVAGEWLRAPLWLSGAASPIDLQTRYARLFEAQRELARTYLDA